RPVADHRGMRSARGTQPRGGYLVGGPGQVRRGRVGEVNLIGRVGESFALLASLVRQGEQGIYCKNEFRGHRRGVFRGEGGTTGKELLEGHLSPASIGFWTVRRTGQPNLASKSRRTSWAARSACSRSLKVRIRPEGVLASTAFEVAPGETEKRGPGRPKKTSGN